MFAMSVSISRLDAKCTLSPNCAEMDEGTLETNKNFIGTSPFYPILYSTTMFQLSDAEKQRTRLQVGAVKGLDVNNEVDTTVAEDEDTDAAAARVESLLDAVAEVGLLADRDVGLDVASLGHAGDATLLDVKDAVLLGDGSENGVDENAGSRVGGQGRVLVELLGEDIDTEVAGLASGGRLGDLDDGAGTALEDEGITEADVVGGNDDGVGNVGLSRVTGAGTRHSVVMVTAGHFV